MIYIFEYDIVPGLQKEFFQFMQAEGGKFWTQFDFVKSYTIYSKLGGGPIFEGHVELESFAQFQVIRSHPDWGKISEKTSRYVLNTKRHFLLPELVID